ncbi:Hypothetical protein NocV09_10900040, partial [Nannochloropsis oceanica]
EGGRDGDGGGKPWSKTTFLIIVLPLPSSSSPPPFLLPSLPGLMLMIQRARSM